MLTKMKEGFRWYGDRDVVPLSYIAQSGATGVFTALHGIPYGEVWSVEAVRARVEKLAQFGLSWDVVESLPVSEDIKIRAGDFRRHIENYKESIRNLAACSVHRIVYNFMPVLDWIRTDLHFKKPDGSTCLKFDPAQFAAFDLFVLARPAAKDEWDAETAVRAAEFYGSLDDARKADFERSIIDVFPGCKMGLEIGDVRKMLARYDGIDARRLRENLALFLAEVLPVAEECGSILAIHPDDPPFPVLGLPRIASVLSDFEDIFMRNPSAANTVCFCTGSLSANPANNLPEMADALADRIQVAHLRSTQRTADGSFFESGHLEGSVPMPEVVEKLLRIQENLLSRGIDPIVFRPDHGCDMADDLSKPPPENPGYNFIGRLKGLAEIRGLELGIISCLNKQK